MVIPMYKYSFLVYHKEFDSFLQDIQQLGVLHVIEKEADESDNIRKRYQLVASIEKAIKFLSKREVEQDESAENTKDGLEILEQINQKQSEHENLEQELAAEKKELLKVEPWGEFSKDKIEELKKENIYFRFFITSKKKFDAPAIQELNPEFIARQGSEIYFVIIQKGFKTVDIDAEEMELPDRTGSDIKNNIKEIDNKLEKLQEDFDQLAKTAIPALENAKNKLLEESEYEKVVYNSEHQADDKIRVLEGFVPNTKKKEIDEYLDKNNVFYIADKPSPEDKVPVLLKNDKFSRLFEPIGKLFSLPAYSELDLTVFFAPFFMMFFGFCLGDAGYGLLFIVGGALYKLKAKKDEKPIVTLLQLLGVATFIFGTISGTLFGINLIESDFKLVEQYKEMFFDPDQMFRLSLILGGVQIVFGLIIKSANQIKQYGFQHALSTFGWLIILVGVAIYQLLVSQAIISESNIILYSIISLGGFFILFFSDPEAGIPARIGKGIWDTYTTVTGIFGDLLSYIRLFALGLSSAILGFVVNDIAMQILGSAPIIGHLLFVIFLILGHGLNIMISSLGSFVHPMRLTFVEFYKNAGFKGGGKEYKPFSKTTDN